MSFYRWKPSKAAKKEFAEKMGETVQLRDEYHPGGRDGETIYIHASKTRIIQIRNDLKAGFKLDGFGRMENI